jgi:hypothetical protein
MGSESLGRLWDSMGTGTVGQGNTRTLGGRRTLNTRLAKVCFVGRRNGTDIDQGGDRMQARWDGLAGLSGRGPVA